MRQRTSKTKAIIFSIPLPRRARESPMRETAKYMTKPCAPPASCSDVSSGPPRGRVDTAFIPTRQYNSHEHKFCVTTAEAGMASVAHVSPRAAAASTAYYVHRGARRPTREQRLTSISGAPLTNSLLRGLSPIDRQSTDIDLRSRLPPGSVVWPM